MKSTHKESGLVSILTVTLFMIFVSIMVVGFIKIMADEQRQATDNDLSASALAAAQSGVEDGKRVIMHCLSSGLSVGEQGQCNNLFSSGSATDPCDSFKNGAKGLFNSMGIKYDTQTNEAIVGSPEFNQYYTCLTITTDPNEVRKKLTAGNSEFIPLNVSGNYDSINLTWSADTGVWGERSPSFGSDFYSVGAWRDMSGVQRPPVLRAQVIPYPVAGGIDLDTVERQSDAFFFVPATGPLATGVIDRAQDGRGATGSPRSGAVPLAYTDCTLGAGTSGYSCSMRISGFTPATDKYYLRLSLLYGASTNIIVKALDTTAGNAERTFRGVQYVIDVTGRTTNAYRRVQSTVSPNSTGAYPEYAVDTGKLLCKDIVVADAATTRYCP